MSVEQQLIRVSPRKNTAVTIGTFDGVHRGHQHLFHWLKKQAQAADLLTCAITFRNQPRSVLVPGAEVEYITPWAERKALIKAHGVDILVPLDFTKKLAAIRAKEFVALLVKHLRMKALVVGPDFALGYRREGDIATLTALGKDMGFEVVTLDPEGIDGQPIRSRVLRKIIGDGQVAEAAKLLGRPYSASGVVVEGNHRGRELGFPTANLSMDPGVLAPRDGIFATWAVIDGKRMPSATSIGVRPTFGPGPRHFEVFVMDFDGDLYGETITVEFVRQLRGEQFFESVSDLVEQMAKDVEQARCVLAGGVG